MMQNWQFFLQKEGDYAWLPLETPQVEILEGRYQLIAHTANVGQSVQVNIRHQYEQEDIPQENIQESIRQIGLSGKVEILPLIYLGLGSWSISCHPEGDSEGLGAELSEAIESYDLEIQVLSQDFDLFEDWNFGDAQTQEDNVEDRQDLEVPVLTESWVEIPPEVVIPVARISSVNELERPESQTSHQTLNSVLESQETVGIDEIQDSASCVSPSRELLLPSFSTSAPSQVFRIVSPNELPLPVSDRELPVIQSPQLPVFTKVKAVVATKQAQRSWALTKIRGIAAAVSQRACPDIAPEMRQEKFYSKLNRIAVGAEI